MKKILTLAFISIVFIGQASAQLKKGEKMLGANVGFTSANAEDNGIYNNKQEGTSISIVPQLGFGVGNNWIVGIQAGYQYVKQRNESTMGWQQNKSNGFTGGVFARKSFPIGERFGLFGQGDLTYAGSKSVYTSSGGGPNSKSKGHSIMVAVGPGAYLRASKRFIVEATVGSLGYVTTESKPDGGGPKSTSNIVFLNLTSNLGLGFKIVL